ncbi:helix-turn-helix domain-containing protein [Jiulongibacter sediminis]|uniref:AraC family transcriptional regulator n=1 Tax=Jiulongibacter sediminis TaxID=1605367 RepID=A0A0P7BLJ3_9BACT|nr:AraC family transcriptional regulator [Jiulongibacter sediminis]KPM48114.1 AraC family transcriptional regulator [Jiulongibacter sediminis]TBX24288.1 AraC family transcriptional regulator [Jiulongibacter sediminis]
MKIELEQIKSEDKSFQLMFNPRLSDLFYWHFHPELELVYIEAERGKRHVGDHISHFSGSDLVLIGSNIPHLNFDHGIKTEYRKVVLHLDKDFVSEQLLKTPELKHLGSLFEKAKYGIALGSKEKKEIGQRLFDLENLHSFNRYIEILKILSDLSQFTESELLHDEPYTRLINQNDENRIRSIYTFIDTHFQEKISLEEIAEAHHFSREGFSRYFKKRTGSTFTDFVNRYRVSQAKLMLENNHSISDACFNCGFESLSYFTRVFKKVSGENPGEFVRKLTSTK